MSGGRWIVAIIGAVASLCFAVLAGRSLGVLAIAPHFFRASSAVFAIATGWLAYQSLRTATSGRTDDDSVYSALRSGIGGAFVGLLILIVAFSMWGQTASSHFAHPLGFHSSQVSMFRLLFVILCSGFGAGFVLRMPKLRKDQTQELT